MGVAHKVGNFFMKYGPMHCSDCVTKQKNRKLPGRTHSGSMVKQRQHQLTASASFHALQVQIALLSHSTKTNSFELENPTKHHQKIKNDVEIGHYFGHSDGYGSS